jgi:rhodanese-related sulfurtransferase
MISSDALAALMRGSLPHAVLDVRERAAYERGHIYCATSVPRRLLETRLPLLVTAKRTPIVLYDEDGRVAALAAATVSAMGFRDVHVLEGGLAAWRAAGRRLVQGLNVPSKVFGEQALHRYRTPEVSCTELAGRIERGERMVIVDSRTPEEYARGCIPGAVSVPGAELVLRITDLVPSPAVPIVVHCGGRTRSFIGAESLRRMDLPNPIVALRNGTMGWHLDGLTLERGAARWAPPVSAASRAAGERVAARVAAEDGVTLVEPKHVQALLARRDEEDVFFLDVRTAEEYAAGHPAGATWAPGGQVIQATDEYVGVRAGTIVLTCDGLVRSVMTASWLMRMGFSRVRVLGGGLPAWTAAGGDVEAGHPAVVPFGYEAARRTTATITPASLAAELAEPTAPVVVDVDPSDGYTRGQVPGATWLCRGRLELTIDAAVPVDRPVVLVCEDGIASTLAAAALVANGRGQVRALGGGKRAWREAGLLLDTGPTKLGDDADDVVLKPYDRGRDAMEAYLRWETDLDDEGVSPHVLLPGVPRP